jgi:hypothetical protein
MQGMDFILDSDEHQAPFFDGLAKPARPLLATL